MEEGNTVRFRQAVNVQQAISK